MEKDNPELRHQNTNPYTPKGFDLYAHRAADQHAYLYFDPAHEYPDVNPD